MQFTKSQQAAMETRGKTVLVSAAAGSGKTFTLTTRIINSVIGDGEHGDDLSRKLIVTFTRAAAGELREKIFTKLSAAIAADPSNTRLQDQLVRLGSAKISTIDSFLLDPIKNNFERLGLPAHIRLADDAELREARERLMQSVLDRMYEKYSVCADGGLESPNFVSDYTDLINILTSARDSSALIPTLYSLYEKLITSEAGVERLREFAERLHADSGRDFFLTPEGEIIREYITSLCEHSYFVLSECDALINGTGELYTKYSALFEDYRSIILTIEQAAKKGYPSLCTALGGLKFPTAPRLKPDLHTSESIYIKDKLLPELRDAFKRVKLEYASIEADEISQEYVKSARLCKVLYEILGCFESLYMDEKVRSGLLEFSDMPRYMLKLLRDDDKNPSDIARGLSSQFTEVYIDEYQDVNEVQDKIFELIGEDRRFMVGDIKQSIYGFRDADPSIFASYRQKFPSYDSPNAENADGCTVFMSNNFRCDKSIIDFTNLVCAPIFSACGESMGYTEDDDLVYSKGDGGGSFPVVLNLIQKPDEENEDEDDEESDDEIALDDEATVVANEIVRLLKHGAKANGERIMPSDICVLVRSKNTAAPLMQALSRLGIAYSISSKSELFESGDMRMLINLLDVVDNPRRDTPLFELMTSERIGLFTIEEAITIRRASENSKSLYDAILSYGAPDEGGERPITVLSLRCREFCEKCEKLRLYSMRVSADKLLRALASDSDFSPICRGEAFTYLYDSARRRTRVSYDGLYSFIEYFKKLMEKGDSSSGEPIGEDTRHVKIMTIHQSKGLEFNTCFVYGLGKKFNLADSKEPMIFDRSISIGLKIPERGGDDFYDAAYPTKKNTMIRRALSLAINRKQIEEEMRIFYVALTRARERLYLSAKLSTTYEKAMMGASTVGRSAHEMRNTKKYISWVLSAICGNTDGVQINLTNIGEASLNERYDTPDTPEIIGKGDRRSADYAALIEEPIAIGDDEKKLSMIPSKIAASKVAPDMLDRAIFLPLTASETVDKEESEIGSETERSVKYRIELMRSSQPDFSSIIDENKRPTASERGTAIHEFLQFCDYDELALFGYDHELARLREKGFMSERNVKIINRRHLHDFIHSDLFSLIRQAKNVRREFRFGSFVPALEFTQNEHMRELLADKTIYVQGSVDLIIEGEDGSIILCDYKSDRLSEEELSDYDGLCRIMNERHSEQLREYCRAIERIFKRSPDRVYIYSFVAGRLVEICI